MTRLRPMKGRSRAATVAVAALLGALASAVAAPAADIPKRVASLNLAADEILVEILPPDRIVALTQFIDEKGTSNALGRAPASIPRLPRADLERLIDLRPDLVIVSQYTDADFLRALETSGLRAHRMTGLDSIEGFRRGVIDLGAAVGAPSAAARLVKDFDERMARLEERLRGVPRPRVFYWASGFTAGSATAFDALIRCGGGRNAAAESGLAGIAPVGAERAFSIRPEWLLIGRDSSTAREIRRDPLLSRLDAVREGRVIEIPTELLVALNHHAAGACEFIARALHPGRFAPPPPAR